MALDVRNVVADGRIVVVADSSGALYSYKADLDLDAPQSPTRQSWHVFSISRQQWLPTLALGTLARESGADSLGELEAMARTALGLGNMNGDGGEPVPTNGEFNGDDDFMDGIDEDLGDEPEVILAGLPAVVPATTLLARLAPLLGTTMTRSLRSAISAIPMGTQFGLSRLPAWLRTVLTALGVSEGIQIVADLGDVDLPDFPGFPGGNGVDPGVDPVGQMVAAMTVSTWQANGVTFHRLSDGRLATRNKHGVWKVWRPKRPVVLFSTGNKDLQDVLKADRIVQKEAEKMARTLRRRGFQVRRKTNPSE